MGIQARLGAAAFAIGVLLVAPCVQAASLPVAVAANFTGVAKKLATGFKADTGSELQLSFGSSGALFAQISQGAPFEIFLSADTERPERAIKDGLGVAGTSFVYARGRLVLYSPSLDVSDGPAVLKSDNYAHLAVADAEAAPYGAAAMQTLKALGLVDQVQPRLVVGENISQTLQFVISGNAPLGFVALSQVIGASGSRWLVPASLYAPIAQGAVLLTPGKDDPAARAFLAYLKGDKARALIEEAGYEVPR